MTYHVGRWAIRACAHPGPLGLAAQALVIPHLVIHCATGAPVRMPVPRELPPLRDAPWTEKGKGVVAALVYACLQSSVDPEPGPITQRRRANPNISRSTVLDCKCGRTTQDIAACCAPAVPLVRESV